MTCLHAVQAERFNGPLTQIIATDGTCHVHIDPVSGKLCDAAGEVGRRSTKTRAIGKHVPQYLANADDSCAGHHGEISKFHSRSMGHHHFTERQQNVARARTFTIFAEDHRPQITAPTSRVAIVKKSRLGSSQSSRHFAVSRVAFSPDSRNTPAHSVERSPSAATKIRSYVVVDSATA